jgi:hypothetical protein
MQLTSTVRIISENLSRRGLRAMYWELSRTAGRAARLLAPANRSFAKVVARDMARFIVGGKEPGAGNREREDAAVRWLLNAECAAGGVSLGYFPCDGGPPWRPPYPETTGYIVSSLLRYARRRRVEVVRRRALEMAAWELTVQMANGAIQGGPFVPSIPQVPCAFNTGMVLDGWCSACEATANSEFVGAARLAAEFLVSDLDTRGYFCTNGPFVSAEPIKTYNCLCAWSIYRFGQLAQEPRYQVAAILAIEAAIRQQRDNGWFANNCLTRPEAPLLHTIGYTLQGILEVGILAGREDLIRAVRAGVQPLLSRISPTGFLPGRFYSDWEPACFSSCLTGSAQLAVICYRLHAYTGDATYREYADLLLNFLKPLQLLDSDCTHVNGALSGSFPIFGEYMTAGYPNWATKYLLDALMLQDEATSPTETDVYVVEGIQNR